VAIKALRPHVVEDDPKLIERFKREGEALKELNHPSIVKILATVEENDQHFIVMEYVPGGSLYDLLKREGKLSLERVLYIALDLSDALIRTHRLKITHRDIKPANVLLAEDGTPRLTDFGTARIDKLENITQRGGIVGTVSYLSPEACRGKSVDARTDIWSFGVMLYEMLSGQRPFDKPETLATVIAITKEPLPDLVSSLPGVPPTLISLIYKMLEKDPAQRIPSMRRVGAELESIIAQADTGTRQALDLIYRMLERDDNQADPLVSPRQLISASLQSAAEPDTAGSTSAQTPQPQARRALRGDGFERQSPTPVQVPTPDHTPPARIPRNTVILGGLLVIALAVIVILLIMM
jgi:serine/threonine protein kinase